MKIAMVIVHFYPEMIGGAEWYVYNVSRELVKMGHEVHVFTSVRRQSAQDQYPRQAEGVAIHRIPLSLNLSHKVKLWRGLEEAIILENPDVIHTFDHAQVHSYLAMLASKKLNRPLILTVFDVHRLIPRPVHKQIPMNAVEWVAARTTLAKADFVLARAPELVPSLLKMGVSQERILVTPSGIRTECLVQANGSAFLSKYGIHGQPVILDLGRLHPSKGLEYLMRAATLVLREFPSASFVLTGPDWNAYSERISESAQSLGIRDRVYLTGPIYDLVEKMNAYASCDVFALPSGYEGTSQAIFEAMSQARPIVATRRGGIPSQVEDGKEAILVEFGDVEALGKALVTILKDKKAASRLGENAKEKVKLFTYPILSRKIAEIYGIASRRNRDRA